MSGRGRGYADDFGRPIDDWEDDWDSRGGDGPGLGPPTPQVELSARAAERRLQPLGLGELFKPFEEFAAENFKPPEVFNRFTQSRDMLSQLKILMFEIEKGNYVLCSLDMDMSESNNNVEVRMKLVPGSRFDPTDDGYPPAPKPPETPLVAAGAAPARQLILDD
jgi:hypothetical protein